MAPIECGGVRANENETRKFTHRIGDDIYEIELFGRKEGGYFHYHHEWFDGRRNRYISGMGWEVEKGKEDVHSSTGLVIKGF